MLLNALTNANVHLYRDYRVTGETKTKPDIARANVT